MKLVETFNYRKKKAGEVAFSKSSLSDPFVQQMISALAKTFGTMQKEVLKRSDGGKIDEPTIIDFIQNKVAENQQLSNASPILFQNITDNTVESTIFKLLCLADQPTGAPKFSHKMFTKLKNTLQGEFDEFFPLRGFIQRRPLANLVIEYVDNPINFFDNKNKKLNTAAATPSGKFIFNLPFMQKLMDYAHLKQVKPRGKKYVSNGGPIPDEYCYIEFLIMHEFMHYSNDDFFYQNILPQAKNKVINYVGDFRTNYLLIKSGFEQLPLGLFSDAVNYDRQATYAEMYNLVLEEMKKLPKGEGDDGDGADGLDDNENDDHIEGQEEGGKPGPDGSKPGEGKDVSDIDKHNKDVNEQIEEGEENRDTGKNDKDSDATSRGKAGNPGTGKGGSVDIDWSKINPKFDWKSIVKRFLSSAPKAEATYAKMHRRSVGGLEIMRQTGGGAIKPADVPAEYVEANLTFVFDSSGSMSSIIDTVFANAAKLLQMPMFRRSEVFLIKFSGDVEINRCNVAGNKAATVLSVNDKPAKWNTTITNILQKHFGGGTVFDTAVTAPIYQLLQKKHNVIIVSDGDLVYGSNMTNLLSVIKRAPKQVFVIFDSRDTYLSFRQQTGITTDNITYFS